MAKENFLGESAVEEIPFEDLFIEKVLVDIKKRVKKSIDLDENYDYEDCCDKPEKTRTQITDEKMREVLKHLLISSEKDDFMKSKYNFLMFLDGDNSVSKNKFISLITLYYTAIYFDSIELLKEYIQEDVISYNLNDLVLCVLDISFVSFFEKDKLLKILKEDRTLIRNFYEDLRNDTDIEKNKYYGRFANIINKREDFPKRAYSILKKEAMDIYSDEDYINATAEQCRELLTISKDEEVVQKIKWLVNNTDFAINYYDNIYLMFKLFTLEELVEYQISFYDSCFFASANQKNCDMERVKNIYLLNRKITNYCNFLFPGIMSMYDDEMLASFTNNLTHEIKWENCIVDELTPEIENKIRGIVNEYFPTKKKNMLKLLFKK